MLGAASPRFSAMPARDVRLRKDDLPMARTVATLPRRRRGTLGPSTLRLAVWRLRQAWRLLLVAGLGNIAAVMLVCVVPLFTGIALNAGLLSVLTQSPDASHIIIGANTGQPSKDAIDSAQQQLTALVKHDMGPYVTDAATFSISIGPFQVTPSATTPSGGPQPSIYVNGIDMSQVNSQYSLVSGRFPAQTSTDFEIALPQADASTLHVAPGDIVQTQLPGPTPTPFNLTIVGIVAPVANAAANSFPNGPFGPRFGGGPFGAKVFYGGDGFQQFQAVASNDALITLLSQAGLTPQQGPTPQLTWSYPLDLSAIGTGNLNDLLDRLGRLQSDAPASSIFNGQNGLQGGFLASYNYYQLQSYRIQVLVLQIPILLLLLQVFALVLLFVRMMAEMLVDRQAEAIAVLRSRGATRRQVFGAFTLHNILLSLLAVVVGPLLAIPFVRYIAEQTLPANTHQALSGLDGNPVAVAWGLKWWILAAIIVASAAMIFSTNRAAGRNILALRRESARTNAKPFWQRLNLDLIFGGLSLLGYIGYTLAVANVDVRIKVVLSPLSVIAALMLLVAVTLLFLRFLPPLLSLAARLTTRSRSATSMLAFTQMARNPRQPVRMTLLLALATGFTIFTFIFGASQAQRVYDTAAYQVGADFNGQLPTFTPPLAFADIQSKYQSIAGVSSVALGYTTEITPENTISGQDAMVYAVDADTYSATAQWHDQDSTRPLSDLMAQLAAQRASAATADAVPAIVDDATMLGLHLTPGGAFTLPVPGYQQGQTMRFSVLTHVAHIPQIYNNALGDSFDGSAGILVDYQSYAAVYAQDTKAAAPAPNAIWLRTQDDASSLASVRQALGKGELALGNLLDRRQIITQKQTNPLQIDLVNILLIGAGAALFLALVGIWVGSWLNARSRIVNFAVLRALGTTPRQLRWMIVWEQAIIYIGAIVLGAAVGFLLSTTALPLLIFADFATNNNFNQLVLEVPPARVMVPGMTLGIAFGNLVLICILALVITMGAASRLSLGQTLRLNED
jgi:ABC-type lipoprotein release transport system permease subunit